MVRRFVAFLTLVLVASWWATPMSFADGKSGLSEPSESKSAASTVAAEAEAEEAEESEGRDPDLSSDDDACTREALVRASSFRRAAVDAIEDRAATLASLGARCARGPPTA